MKENKNSGTLPPFLSGTNPTWGEVILPRVPIGIYEYQAELKAELKKLRFY
jgi:hypothetical protein